MVSFQWRKVLASQDTIQQRLFIASPDPGRLWILVPLLMSSKMIKLNILVNTSHACKTLEFDELSLVLDVCSKIRRLPDSAKGDQCGLLRLHQDTAKSRWLQTDKTLKDCSLKNGDTLQYRTRIRSLCVRTLEKFEKVVSIDDAQSVLQVTRFVCSKLGLSNHDEFSFIVNGNNEDSDQMDRLRKKYHLGEKVKWLDPEMTLREQGVSEDTPVTLRKLFIDLDTDQLDSVHLNLSYVQSRDAIIDGIYPCTKEEAVLLAALQCCIQYGKYDASKHTPGFLPLGDFVPNVYSSALGIEALIFNEYHKLKKTGAVEAKKKYIQLCSSLPTYGITFFLVQERLAGNEKHAFCLLGVGRCSIIRLDVKQKNIISSWPLHTIRRWMCSHDSFSLDFGKYPGSYIARTTEGEAISNFISSYVNAVSKKQHTTAADDMQDDHLYDMVTENEIVMEDCIAYVSSSAHRYATTTKS